MATVESGGEPSVAVGDFQSSGDEDQAAKYREETKRLLYVAVTRARDRLYLGSALKDGLIQPGRGSLAEVLPPAFLAKFGEASAAHTVSWRASSGDVHLLRSVRLQADQYGPAEAGHYEHPAEAGQDVRHERDATVNSRVDFQPLEDRAASRLPVGDAIAETGPSVKEIGGASSDRLVGILVHRLLQRQGLASDVSDAWIADRLASLLRQDEMAGVVDRGSLVARAASAYRAFSEHADLRRLYSSGTPFHEVPFSLAIDGQIVRGSIDCLVHEDDGRVTVLEFKTGGRRVEHQSQSDLYRLAAQALFPDAEVATHLIYSGEVVSS